MGVPPGEALVAVASVLGGLIGAFGAGGAAVYAVRRTFERQRKEERQRIVGAILREVMEFSRRVVGHLKIFENIHSGKMLIPAAQFPTIMRMPNAVVYPAIADRLGLLNNPTLVVAFFTRMSDAGPMAAVIGAQGTVGIRGDLMTEMAKAWIDICEMGKCILDGEQEFERDVDRQAREDILKQIEEALKSARTQFPETSA